MSSAGATKNKPKKTSNLRILWIPGRKKHNRKGTYNPTKNGLPQTYGMQPRKNEPWTLGGPLNQSKIINADLHENNLDVASIAAGGAMSLAAMASNGTLKANGSAVPEQQQQQQHQEHDRLQAEPMPSTSQTGTPPQPQIVIGTIELNNLNGDAGNIKQEKDIGTSNQFETLTLIDEDDEEEKDRNCSNAHSSSSLLSSNNDNRSAEENNVHSAATLSISEQHRRRARRRSSSQKGRRSPEDIDSIDRADSAVDVATHGDDANAFEDDEQQRVTNGPHDGPVVLRKRKSKRRSQRRRTASTEMPQDAVDGVEEQEEKKEPYDKAVTCLYWSLACWDCTIS